MSDRRTDRSKVRAVNRWVLVVVLPTAVVFSVAPTFAQEVAMDKLESALLGENWSEASTLLDGVTADAEKSPDPVLRLVKGHVELVQNHNNNSVGLFLSVTTPKDLEKCRQWAEKLWNRNKENAVAHYFRGDVQARLHNYDQAIKEFSEGLKKQPGPVGHALLHNARGVARAHSNDPKIVGRARNDFDAATSDSNVKLADAWANLGAYRIQRKDGADKAIEAFNNALAESHEFALALHGRGCVRIIQKDMENAEKDLEAARKDAKGAMIDLLASDLLKAAVSVASVDENGEKVLRSTLDEKGVGSTFMNKFVKDKDGNGTRNWQFRLNINGGLSKNGKSLSAKLIKAVAPYAQVNVGGILTSFEQGVIDGGQWPFTPLYGLTFDASAKDAIRFASTTAKEQL